MMRPSVPSPTGTAIGCPVSVTSWPRTKPSEMSIATVRTVDLAKMLRHFEHQAVALVLGLQRIEDRRQLAFELHVDDGADDLRDASALIAFVGHGYPLRRKYRRYSASAPEMISISSLVIIAWRVRL